MYFDTKIEIDNPVHFSNMAQVVDYFMGDKGIYGDGHTTITMKSIVENGHDEVVLCCISIQVRTQEYGVLYPKVYISSKDLRNPDRWTSSKVWLALQLNLLTIIRERKIMLAGMSIDEKELANLIPLEEIDNVLSDNEQEP